MKIEPRKTVAFTGHRTYGGECGERLADAIRRFRAQGYDTFLSGMAVGFDLASAETVLALKAEMPGVRLVCVVPFDGHDEGFSAEDRERFARTVREADETIILARHYSPDVYHRRNDFLVDNSSAVIAYCDGSRSGTLYTLKRALKRGSATENLYPDPQQKFVFPFMPDDGEIRHL